MESFQLSDAFQLITSKLETWISEFISMLPNFLISCLIVVVFWLIARAVRKLLIKGLQKVSDSEALIKLSGTLAYFGVIAIGTFVALSVVHLDKAVTSLLAGVGVIGLALAFAFQDIAANFVAGVLMATNKPFKIGDLVATNGFEGNITDMNLRASTLRTYQGQDVIIPNKEIFQNPLTNFTTHPKRRIDLNVGVSYGDDLEKSEEVAMKAIEALSIIDSDEGVSMFYHTFGDSSVNFTIRFWVDEHKQAKYLAAMSQGVKAIKKAFDENEITIPFPIRTLDFGIKGGKSISSTELHVINQSN